MKPWREGLGADIPIYVTRKDAGGKTGSISSGAWLVLLLYLLTAANAVLWGVYGVVQAAERLF